MLELTNGGRCISGPDAIAFFERLGDAIDDDVKTPEFCDEYEHALNRLRHEVRKSIPIPVKALKTRYTTYSCGQCGRGADAGYNFCPECGRRIGWTKET